MSSNTILEKNDVIFKKLKKYLKGQYLKLTLQLDFCPILGVNFNSLICLLNKKPTTTKIVGWFSDNKLNMIFILN